MKLQAGEWDCSDNAFFLVLFYYPILVWRSEFVIFVFLLMKHQGSGSCRCKLPLFQTEEVMVGMNEQSPGKQAEGLVNFFKITPLTPGLDICYRCTKQTWTK